MRQGDSRGAKTRQIYREKWPSSLIVASGRMERSGQLATGHGVEGQTRCFLAHKGANREMTQRASAAPCDEKEEKRYRVNSP